jgi:hypothetical protein
MIPERASGSMICQKLRIADAPSSAAASPTSPGNDRKNPVSRNAVNGTCVAG